MVRETRGRRLFPVAGVVWLLGLTSVLFLGITRVQSFVRGLAIFFACLFGGGIAALLFGSRPWALAVRAVGCRVQRRRPDASSGSRSAGATDPHLR